MRKSRKGVALGLYSREPRELKTFGDRVLEMRVGWLWTQTRLADALWVSQKTIARWEGAGGIPNPTALKRLKAITGLGPDAWLTGTGWAFPNPPLDLRGHLVPHELAPHVVLLPERGHGLWKIRPDSEWDCTELTPEEAIKAVRDITRTTGALYLISST